MEMAGKRGGARVPSRLKDLKGIKRKTRVRARGLILAGVFSNPIGKFGVGFGVGIGGISKDSRCAPANKGGKSLGDKPRPFLVVATACSLAGHCVCETLGPISNHCRERQLLFVRHISVFRGKF